MKILLENKIYTVVLNASDENISTCTYEVTCSRPDLVTIIQTATLNIFTVTVEEIGEENTVVEFYYKITDEDTNETNTTEYMILKFNQLPFDIYFASLAIASIVRDGSNRIELVMAESGEELHIEYASGLVASEKYYVSGGVRLMLTITYTYHTNGTLLSTTRTL